MHMDVFLPLIFFQLFGATAADQPKVSIKTKAATTTTAASTDAEAAVVVLEVMVLSHLS